MPRRRFRRPQPEGTQVVSFPASPKERRRILRSREDPRGRACTTARTIVGWLLSVAFVMFLLLNYRLFSPSSIRNVAQYVAAGFQQRKGELAAINYEKGSFSDAALFRSSLAYVDADTIYLARPGNLQVRSHQLSYTSDFLQVNNDYMFTYEAGGYKATLLNAYSTVTELTTESPILAGFLSQSDKFVLITDENGYRSAVALYNENSEELFKWSTSEYYALSAALSPDEKTLAILTFQQDGLALNSHVMLYAMSSGELISQTTIPNAFGAELGYLGNGMIGVICDNGVYTVNKKGESAQVLSYSSEDLQYFEFEGHMISIVTRAHSGAARSALTLLHADGTHSEPLLLTEEPTSVAIAGTKVGILTTTGLSIYNTDLTPLYKNSEAVGARDLLLMNDGTVYVLFAQNARVFNSISEQSEAIPHDES